MLALYRAGRQARALEAYRQRRHALAAELRARARPGAPAPRARDPDLRPGAWISRPRRRPTAAAACRGAQAGLDPRRSTCTGPQRSRASPSGCAQRWTCWRPSRPTRSRRRAGRGPMPADALVATSARRPRSRIMRGARWSRRSRSANGWRAVRRRAVAARRRRGGRGADQRAPERRVDRDRSARSTLAGRLARQADRGEIRIGDRMRGRRRRGVVRAPAGATRSSAPARRLAHRWRELRRTFVGRESELELLKPPTSGCSAPRARTSSRSSATRASARRASSAPSATSWRRRRVAGSWAAAGRYGRMNTYRPLGEIVRAVLGLDADDPPEVQSPSAWGRDDLRPLLGLAPETRAHALGGEGTAHAGLDRAARGADRGRRGSSSSSRTSTGPRTRSSSCSPSPRARRAGRCCWSPRRGPS